MFQGDEISKDYDGGAGKFKLDVNDQGLVAIENSYEKEVDGLVKVKSVTTLETSVFKILERIAAKTETTFDDKAIAGIKSILGIKS